MSAGGTRQVGGKLLRGSRETENVYYTFLFSPRMRGLTVGARVALRPRCDKGAGGEYACSLLGEGKALERVKNITPSH